MSLIDNLRGFIPGDSPLGRAGGADMLLRVSGGNVREAAFLAALARKESSFGAQAFVPNNFWGYGIHAGSSVNRAPSVEAMASRVLQGLRGNLYRGAGLTSAGEIINRYAPPSENNTSLYQDQVSEWLRGIGIDPTQSIFDGSPTAAAGQAPSMAGAPSGGGAPAPPAPAGPNGLQLLSALRDLHSAEGIDRVGAVANLVNLVRQRHAAAAPAAPAQDQAADPAAQVHGDFAMPLGTMGSVIGTPHAGTHTLGNWESDNAVDIAAKVGTPVYALEDGTIGKQFGSLGSGGRFAGLRLHLDAPNDSFYYAHLSRFAPGIAPGRQVRRGQILGYSGEANGVGHLHLGARSGDLRDLLGLR